MALKTAYRVVAVAFCLELASQAATLVRDPYLQNVRADRATILWTTDQSVEGGVVYSTDPGFSSRTTILAVTRRFGTTETGLPAAYFQHQADLAGLTAGTVYFYRILADGDDLSPAPLGDLRFRTAAPGRFTFLVFGDSGQGSTPQRELAQRMTRNENPSLVVHVGDLAYETGTFEQFQKNYFDVYRDLMKRVPFFTAPGNHEYYTNNAAPYLALHAPPTETVPLPDQKRYYSFDWGNVHFVSLDSNAPLSRAAEGTGPMLQWLENDLQRAQQTWKIVYFHHTPYPLVQHEDDPLSKLANARIVPLMDKYFVDLVFSGHEHNYQRTQPLAANQTTDDRLGTVYITSGGGGGPLHPSLPRPNQAFADSFYHYVRAEVDGSQITLTAIQNDGQVRDAATLRPRLKLTGEPPQLTSEGVVNAASFTPSLAPGMIVSVFGRNLAVEEARAQATPLPTRISGTRLTLGGQPLPLFYVSPTQVNAQLPFDLLGRTTLQVTTPNGSGPDVSLVVSDAAPGIFTASPDPVVVHTDGTLVTASSPARPGEPVVIYLTGLGGVSGQITAGEPAPAFPLLTTQAAVQVQFGSVSVTPSFAGLTPGFAGLYQVNTQVPPGLPSGRQTVRIMARGVASNTVSLAIR